MPRFDIRHGTRGAGYTYGNCRCAECRAASALYVTKWRLRTGRTQRSIALEREA